MKLDLARTMRAGPVLAVGLLLTLGGCETSKVGPSCPSDLFSQNDQVIVVGPVLMPQTPGAFEPLPLNTVRYVDRSIEKKVKVQSVGVSRTATDTVKVSARFVNCTGDNLQLEARTHFLDQSQAATEKPSNWARFFLNAHSFATYDESSIDIARVAYFSIEIRGAQ